jgi:hypothetical protein
MVDDGISLLCFVRLNAYVCNLSAQIILSMILYCKKTIRGSAYLGFLVFIGGFLAYTIFAAPMKYVLYRLNKQK